MNLIIPSNTDAHLLIEFALIKENRLVTTQQNITHENCQIYLKPQ